MAFSQGVRKTNHWFGGVVSHNAGNLCSVGKSTFQWSYFHIAEESLQSREDEDEHVEDLNRQRDRHSLLLGNVQRVVDKVDLLPLGDWRHVRSTDIARYVEHVDRLRLHCTVDEEVGEVLLADGIRCAGAIAEE